jgi:diguanylate cyclase (GGDEF)-like protein
MIEALQGIPGPPVTVIEPRALAAYGALLAAALLSVLYFYRGRAFIVHWIVSWLLLAGSLALQSRGYADPRLGGVVLGFAQLLGAWSGGFLWLAARAFPDGPRRSTVPAQLVVLSGVWFVAAPLVVPLRGILVTGQTIGGFILAWCAIEYLRLFRSSRFVGTAFLGAGLAFLSMADFFAGGVVLEGSQASPLLNRVLAFDVVVNIFVALGMHLLVFEHMTAELRRANDELASANHEVRRLAITDSLTGCYNRRFFDEIERRELQRHQRYGSSLSVMFVDVNRFKRLNDTLGHATGDEVLRAIGAMLRRQVRSSDYVIRWGGDEFMLLLTCTMEQAQHKATELKEAFHADPATRDLPGGVGLSIGAAEVATDAENLAGAIRLADERMYQDKFKDRAGLTT